MINIWVYAQIDGGNGTMGCSVDGGPQTVVNLNGSPTTNPLVYTSAALAAGTHTLKLVPVSGYADVDKVVITP